MLKNRYEIVSDLSEGGFGSTFLAKDTQTPSSKKCVIKKLKPINDNPQIYQLIKERFEREAAILEDLGDRHPQIPRLYAYFEEQGNFYLVQEWIDGQTLTQRVEKHGPLSESKVKAILLDILPVLQLIHSKGIIHRDIKPDNIIIKAADEKPVLIDFGAVKESVVTTEVSKSGQMKSSIIIGTPGFMPLEQTVGKPLFSSDIYSLGLTAIYLLTAKLPEQLKSNPETGEIIWREHASNLSPAFAAILDKAIEPNYRDRYLNSFKMLEALNSLDNPASLNTVPGTQLEGNSQQSSSVPNTKLDYSNNKIGQNQQQYQGNNTPIPSTQQQYPGNNLPVYQNPQQYPGNNSPVHQNQPQYLQGNYHQPSNPTQSNQKNIIIGLLAAAALIGAGVYLSKPKPEPTPVVQNDPSINNPDTPPTTPPDPNPSPTPQGQSEMDIPPTITIGGQPVQATQPTMSIDGVWEVRFTAGETPHDSILIMKGPYGEMITQYTDPQDQRVQKVYQKIRLWAVSGGLIIKGFYPTNVATKQPMETYTPDQILAYRQQNGTLTGQNCSGEGDQVVCSPTTFIYKGKDIK